MADEVSTGIKTTCLQYNSTGRSTFHIQVRNSSYFSFCFEVIWSSKKFWFFLRGIKLFLVLKLAITSNRAKSLNSYSQNKVFLLTRPASILIFWNRRRKKRDFNSRPQDCLGTPTWPSFHCFEHQLGLYDPTTQSQREIQKSNSLEGRTTTLCIYHTFFGHFFCHFLLHDYEVKLLNFTFYGGR